MSEIIFEVTEDAEEGFVAKALGFDIITQADDWPSLKDAVRDAVHCHFAEGQGPRIIRLHMRREEIFAALTANPVMMNDSG